MHQQQVGPVPAFSIVSVCVCGHIASLCTTSHVTFLLHILLELGNCIMPARCHGYTCTRGVEGSKHAAALPGGRPYARINVKAVNVHMGFNSITSPLYS